ncbi:hypothetical protein O5D80_004379 [Batrachochytrium dendrobatidis]|nr:hypothetical protein O5D80_004379 [Batrachochytrium dendrobatidis]
MENGMDMADLVILASIAVLTAGFFAWRNGCSVFGLFDNADKTPSSVNGKAAPPTTGTMSLDKATPASSSKKSLIKEASALTNGNGRLFVIFGSQTGTAEDLATRFVKEASDALGISALICDPEEYDLSELANWRSDGHKDLFGFFFSTYGEGEPTDNAADFYTWLMSGKGIGLDDTETDEEDAMVESQALAGLGYFVFALGNKTYEHYNAIGRRIDKRITKLGGMRVGERGEGDDDKSLEEDFLAWKSNMIAAIAKYYGVNATSSKSMRDCPHVPVFDVVSVPDAESVFSGEHSASHVRTWTPSGSDLDGFEILFNQVYKENKPATVFDAKHPFYSRIVASKTLFHKAYDTIEFSGKQMTTDNPPFWTVSGSKISIQRECYHMEFDLTGSGLVYHTGDHVGVWADNNPVTVNRLAAALDIKDLDRVIDLIPHPNNPLQNTKKPFPLPCTLRAAFTYYLDLSEVLKQYHLETLGKYASDESEKQRLFELSEDRQKYVDIVQNGCKNLAEILEEFKSVKVPLGVVLFELLSRVAVRYYSISSSSAETPEKLTITAVLVRYAIASAPTLSDSKQKSKVVVKEGLATSCLQRKHLSGIIGDTNIDSFADTDKHCSVPTHYLPICIRTSTFRLPADTTTPVMMVGPGTGVAPFRAFVIERVLAAKQGKVVGSTWLFNGCRRKAEDDLYHEEFAKLQQMCKTENLKIDLRIHTAYSRDTAQKVYVQHLLAQHSDEIWDLLYTRRGYFYICGDAKYMAHDVSKALGTIAEKTGGMAEEGGKQWLKDIKTSGRYFEDVWS